MELDNPSPSLGEGLCELYLCKEKTHWIVGKTNFRFTGVNIEQRMLNDEVKEPDVLKSEM